MRPLSSSAAIAPAFRRMRRILFQPFAWGTFFRVTLAAIAAESLIVNFRYLTPHLEFDQFPAVSPAFRHASGFLILIAIAALVALDLVLMGWYAIVRMRFAIFHSVVHGDPALREGLRAYGKAPDRFFRATLLTTLGIIGLIGLVVVVVALGAFSVLNVKTSEGKYDAGVFLIMFFPTIGFAAAVVVAALLARVILHDFVLPHMALENATFSEAWRAVRRQIRADREGFFSYFLLRALLAVVCLPILAVLAWLAMWPVFGALGTAAAGYNALLDEATGWLGVTQVALNSLLLAAGAAAGAMGAAIFGGPLAVFLRAHAVYFYGSRYKPLGDMLEASVQVPAVAERA